MIRGLLGGLALLALAGCGGETTGGSAVPAPADPAPVATTATDPARVATTAADPVRVAQISDVALRAGQSTRVAIEVMIADGFHVQANPASQEFLIPLELELSPVPDLEFGLPEYPPAEFHRLEGAEDDLLTYHGAVSVAVPITASDSPASRQALVRGEMRYQTCDSVRCYFPRSAPVEFQVQITR